ncbi:MAG: DMT family transporter [Streptomycetales bacterium]
MGSPRVAAALMTTLLLWAAAFVAIRVVLPDLSAGGLTTGRLAVASLAAAAAAPLLRVRRPRRADLPRLLACGLAGMTGYQFLLNAGERTVPAGTASLLIQTGPIWAALLAWAFLAERLRSRVWAGIGLGFVGAVLIAVSEGGGLRPSRDAVFVLAAAGCQAAFFVLQKPLLKRYSGFEVTCYATWAGTLFAVPGSADLIGDLPGASASSVAGLLFLGIGPSAVGFTTYAYALARLDVAVAANALYLVPLLAVLLGWLVLGEVPGPLAVLGGLAAIGGVALSGAAAPAEASRGSTTFKTRTGESRRPA